MFQRSDDNKSIIFNLIYELILKLDIHLSFSAPQNGSHHHNAGGNGPPSKLCYFSSDPSAQGVMVRLARASSRVVQHSRKHHANCTRHDIDVDGQEPFSNGEEPIHHERFEINFWFTRAPSALVYVGVSVGEKSHYFRVMHFYLLFILHLRPETSYAMFSLGVTFFPFSRFPVEVTFSSGFFLREENASMRNFMIYERFDANWMRVEFEGVL